MSNEDYCGPPRGVYHCPSCRTHSGCAEKIRQDALATLLLVPEEYQVREDDLARSVVVSVAKLAVAVEECAAQVNTLASKRAICLTRVAELRDENRLLHATLRDMVTLVERSLSIALSRCLRTDRKRKERLMANPSERHPAMFRLVEVVATLPCPSCGRKPQGINWCATCKDVVHAWHAALDELEGRERGCLVSEDGPDPCDGGDA